MKEKNYSAELAIKKWAYAIHIFAYLFIAIGIVTCLILISVDDDDWVLPVVFAGGGIALSIPTLVISYCLHGFGEIVGNTKKMANGCNAPELQPPLTSNSTDDTLPEL